MKRLLIVLLIVGVKNCFAQQWQPLDSGITSASGNDHTVWDMIVDSVHDILIVGGEFDSAGGKYIPGIATWNSDDFDTLPGLSGGGNIKAMTFYDGQLFFGTTGTVATYVNNTLTLVGSANDNVEDLIVYDNKLIVTGRFTKINGHVCNHIASWDGAQWNDFGNGLTGFFPNGESLTIYNGELIVGGHFDHVDGVACNNIAAWNGNQWSPLGIGISCGSCFTEVSTMIVFHDSLWVGGFLDSAGGNFTGPTATWDGNNWHKATYPLCGVVNDFISVNDTLYSAGAFSLGVSFNCPANRVAKWTGAEWKDLNFGTTGGEVYCLGFYDNQLYIGGDFPSAGGIEVNNIAYTTIPTGIEDIKTIEGLDIYPNPTTDFINVHSRINALMIGVYDMLGRKVLQENNCNSNGCTLDVRKLMAGIYLLRVKTATGEQSVKFVKD